MIANNTRVILAFVATLTALVSVHAQGGGEPSGSVRESVSKEERIAAAEAIVARGTALSDRIAGLLEAARRETDIIRINCLNDKQLQTDTSLRTLDSHVETLRQAADEAMREHESTVIGVIGQKFNTLDQEASQCVGQEVFETGTGSTGTEIDPTQAGEPEDASDVAPPPEPTVIGAVPQPFSPTT